MEGYFPVTVCGKHTGKVLVRRQGLYYHMQCRCDLEGEGIYRLVVTCGGKRENLGILVPEDGGFCLNTKQPVRRIGEGELVFSLVAKQESRGETFVPICPEEPFEYIARLKRGFLAIQNGQAGIYIAEKPGC